MVESGYYQGFQNPHFAEYLARMEPLIDQHKRFNGRIKLGEARTEIIPSLFVIDWDQSRIIRAALTNRVVESERRSSNWGIIYDKEQIYPDEVRALGLLCVLPVAFESLRKRFFWQPAVKTALEISGQSPLRQLFLRADNIGKSPVEEDYLTADPFDLELNLKSEDMSPLNTNQPHEIPVAKSSPEINRSRVIQIARSIQEANLHRSLDGISARRLLELGIKQDEVDQIIGRAESTKKHQDERDPTLLAIYRSCLNLLSSSQ